MATRKNRNNKKYSEILDILSSESDPSDGSTVCSDVVTDPDDPFSHTKEGKEIMRKMKKIKPERKHRRAEYELKRKMKELRMDGPGLRPSVDSLRAASRGPVEWCDLARAQAESREQKGWIGHDEVKDIDSMWLRDIREASEMERKSTLGGDGFNE